MRCPALCYTSSDIFKFNAMTPEPRPVTRRHVLTFVNAYERMRASWLDYQTLFLASDLRRELLREAAGTFFYGLNLTLVEHLILQACKITDPEFTAGKRNLTVEFFVNNSHFSASPDRHAKLAKLAARMNAFPTRIVPARHKLISHLDFHAVQGRKSFGGAPIVAWQQFLDDLHDFVSIIFDRYVGQSFGVPRLSDADLLIKALKESIVFNDLLNNESLTLKVDNIRRNSKYSEA
jgi:hypothetical protein